MLFALYQKISKVVAEFPEEHGNVIVRSSGFHLVDAPHGCGWQHNGCEWTWGTVEHCACAFISVTHGHEPCILQYTQITLCDPRSIGHNPPEDLKIYLTTHTRTVLVKFITVFWEVLTVVAELLDNIQRICDHMKELWIQYFEQIVRPFVPAKRCCPTCMLQQILPTPSLLTTMYNTWKSWTQRSSTCSSLATLWSTAQINFGVESDMIIQQALIRAMNTSGGLTGRWGISESTLAR